MYRAASDRDFIDQYFIGAIPDQMHFEFAVVGLAIADQSGYQGKFVLKVRKRRVLNFSSFANNRRPDAY